MGIRDVIAKRRQMPAIVPVEIAGLGVVRVKRVTTSQALAFENGPQAVAATIVDEEDKPLYAAAADVQQEDWAIVQQLLKAYNEVNTPNAEAAAKK